MKPLLVGLLIAAAVVSRPLEARLWRAGRLSDRTTAVLMLARFPLVCFLYGLIIGMQPLLLVGLTLLALLPGLLFYRFVLDMLRDRAHSAHQSN